MYKVIEIEKKEYKIEYYIEAALYAEVVEETTGLFALMAEAEEENKLKQSLQGLSNIPSVVLTMFYAGLMEHHGEDGDETVLSKKDAKVLLKKYMSENPEQDFYSFMGELVEQMGVDGFFKRIGLEAIFEAPTEQKQTKQPQDHKKKTTKKKEVSEK